MDEYKSLVSGFVSGAIHTIVGFPLDTLKTLKQSNNINKNINFKNIFKGLIYPVSQVSLVNALTFGSNNYFKKNHNHNYINITDLLYSLDIHDVKLFLN